VDVFGIEMSRVAVTGLKWSDLSYTVPTKHMQLERVAINDVLPLIRPPDAMPLIA